MEIKCFFYGSSGFQKYVADVRRTTHYTYIINVAFLLWYLNVIF